MPFDKGKFISDFTGSGMEEGQAELLAENQASLFNQMVSRQDLEGLKQEMTEKMDASAKNLRREISEDGRKTRLLIDDVQRDVIRAEAKLEWRIKEGFETTDTRFNMLMVSNTLVTLTVIVFMFMLFRG